jgi:cell wall-associated NlpC family hydrolase
VGLGLATASPASAAPTEKDTLAAAQTRVEQLSEQAHTVEDRHEDAKSSLDRQRTRAQQLTKKIQRHQRLIKSLRMQVVNSVVEQYGGGGASALPNALPRDSAQLLTTVTVVSEDTGGRTEAMAASGAKVQTLAKQRAATRERITGLRRVEKSLDLRETRADAKVAVASSVLDGLRQKAEAKALAERGGPVLGYAKSQVGKSYVYGAAGPDSFDCSGLTMMAWKQAGVSLPHSSSAQYAAGTKISESELQPGDLVFYYSPISHVGLYIGGGQIVNALNPGSGVQVSGLHDMPYSGAVRPG